MILPTLVVLSLPLPLAKTLVLPCSNSALPFTSSVELKGKKKMIKRRFYKVEHGNRDDPSESSSSSSDSEVEAVASEECEEEDVEEEEEREEIALPEVREQTKSSSSSSGYESEDGSANEVNLDSSGISSNDNDVKAGIEVLGESYSSGKSNGKTVDLHCMDKEGANPSEIGGCVLKMKSVFKCRLCPRIVCLSEETLQAHLKSKRHARSEKLQREGRLKLMLNSDGEIEENTHPEKQVQTVVTGQKISHSRTHKRWQKQKKNLKDKKSGFAKKRRTSDN